MSTLTLTPITEFIEAIEANPEAKTRYAVAESTESIVKLASKMGFNFTVSDYDSYIDDLVAGYEDLPGVVNMSGPIRCPSRWPT